MKKTTNFGIFTLLFVSSLTIMVGAVIAPSLSGIVKNTHFGYAPSWLITLPSLGVIVFAPFVGRLLHKFGTFKLVCFGLIPYGVLGVAGAFFSNDYMLIADRFLLGGAAVTVQVAVTAFIAELFVAEERMKMIAWQGMAVELGGVVFLAVGGVLGEINWQWPFYVYLMAFVCLFLVLKSLPSTPPIRTQETVVSSEGNGNKAKVRIIFAASLLSMMLFFVAYVSLPFYLPETFQFSESDTGFYLSFISIIAVITASQMPKVVRLLGGGKTVVLGFFFFMLGYVVIASTTSLFLLILTAIFFGIGFGFTIPLLNYMMIEVSTPQDQGKNLSLFSMGVFGGQFLSTFIQYISSNYVAVYAVSALLAFSIGGILYYFFQKESQN